MTKNFLRLCAALFFAGAGLAATTSAKAQEVIVTVTAEPSSLVSLHSNGDLFYIGTTMGMMTATVFAVTGTLENGVFTPQYVKATGMAFMTLAAWILAVLRTVATPLAWRAQTPPPPALLR